MQIQMNISETIDEVPLAAWDGHSDRAPILVDAAISVDFGESAVA